MAEQVTSITSVEVYQTMRNGSLDDKIALLDSLPDNTFKENVRPLIGAENTGMGVVALTSLVLSYCNGQNPEIGAELAKGLHQLAVELYQTETNNAGLIATTLTNLASSYITALNLLGRSQEVVNFTGEWIPFYTDTVPENENISSLYVGLAYALLNLYKIDEAEVILKNNDINWNFAANIERNRLLNQIIALKADVTSMKPAEKNDIGGVISDALKNILGDQDNVDIASLLSAKIKEQGGFGEIKNKKDFKNILDALKAGEKYITKDTANENEWTMKGLLRDATSIFYLNDMPDTESIHVSMDKLERVLDWANQNDHGELKNDSLWGYYLCNSRLDEPSIAADCLIALRKNIELLRAGIKNPLERGGAFSTYPGLFGALCRQLFLANRYEEMLESIESSKGRAIADLLTQSSNHITTDIELYEAVNNLPELCVEHKFNYLSIFVDDYDGVSTIYSVLMDKNGKIHSAKPLEMGSDLIKQAVMNLDPKQWNKPDVINPSQKTPAGNELLAPLTSTFEAFINDGALEKEDHLVISGDGHLSNVPWYYLSLFDHYIVDWFSVSRVHNVYHLNKLIQAAVVRPSHYFGIVLPKLNDVSKPNWPIFRNNLYEPIEYIRDKIGLSVDAVLENEKVTVDNIYENIAENQLIHVSTHGFFPDLNSTQNPYHDSGILVSDGHDLPTEECAISGKCMLTPKKVLESGSRMDGCHISLMACVSGLSREGLGGDALGMDWALIQAGAESLASAHWYVDSGEAESFFKSFYRNWYQKEMSRGEAARNASLEMKRKTDNFAWAAFSISGDWR